MLLETRNMREYGSEHPAITLPDGYFKVGSINS